MRKNIIYILLLLLVFSLSAQDFNSRLNEAMEQKRSGNYYGGANPFSDIIQDSPILFIENVIPFMEDTSATVREFTGDLLLNVYLESKDYNAQSRAVEYLCILLNDTTDLVKSAVCSALQNVKRSDFSEKDKQNVEESFSAYQYINEDQVLIAGFLELENISLTLQSLKRDPTQENKIRWNSYLALARMGDEESLDFILESIKKRGINDRVIYNYFPELIYTRQHKAFNYMITEMYDNEKKCGSPNPNIDKEMVCGYRIMEYLAPVIENFPLKMTASGSIDTKNYDKALETTRKWFREKGDYYVINRETF